MINVFVLQNGRLSQIPIESREDLVNVTPVWVDLTDPSDEERDWVSSIFGVMLPDEDEVKDIEMNRQGEGEEIVKMQGLIEEEIKEKARILRSM
jgi:magnesium transporter